MCNNQNVPSVTLQTAVLMQVKEYADKGQTFSVFDVTRALRDKCDNGELEIPEVEVTNRGYRFEILHSKVKELFQELWNTGVFDPDFTLNRNFNGKYFEYLPSPVCGGSVPAPVATPTATPVNVPVTSPVATTSIPVVKVKTPANVVVDRVNGYLVHCQGLNFNPTLKQVQAAIKRRNGSTGWTCEELKGLIEKNLGYAVLTNPNYFSQSPVVTH